jgi:phage antirepressor YoqD-like protein
MEEVLNIKENKVRLIIKSLNSSDSVEQAAARCGLSERTLYRYMRTNKIQWVMEHKKYMVVNYIVRGKNIIL